MSEQDKSYLCYDLRAIQSYIFRVPKLKYIVGGSALVDRFDRETVPGLIKSTGAALVYAAGGKGAVRCANSAQTSAVEIALRKEAARLGLDIRFGRDALRIGSTRSCQTCPKDIPVNSVGSIPSQVDHLAACTRQLRRASSTKAARSLSTLRLGSVLSS